MKPQRFGSKAINGIRIGMGVSSVVVLLLGVFMLFFTGFAADLIGVFLGVSVIVSGLVYAGIGIFSQNLSFWLRALQILIGVMMIIAGLIVMANPEIGLLTVTFAIGFSWILEGVVSLSMISAVTDSAWSVVYGAVSIIAGLLLVIMPFSSAITLIIFSGIALVVIGCVGVFRSFAFGRSV